VGGEFKWGIALKAPSQYWGTQVTSVQYVQTLWGWTSHEVDTFFFNLYNKAALLCGVVVIKAKTLIIRSSVPLWSGSEKCVPTVFLSCFLKRMDSSCRQVQYVLIFPQCPWNCSKNYFFGLTYILFVTFSACYAVH